MNDPEIKGTNQEPLPRYFISILFGTKREDEPLLPEAREAFIRRLQLNGKDDPISHCHPVGVPAINTVPKCDCHAVASPNGSEEHLKIPKHSSWLLFLFGFAFLIWASLDEIMHRADAMTSVSARPLLKERAKRHRRFARTQVLLQRNG